MSSVGECTLELLVFPIVFQTVSFHHRAAYDLRLSFSLPVLRLHPVRQLFAGEQRELVDRNGNAWNVDGHASTPAHFHTSRFPIEYNDQIVKFKTGCLARLHAGPHERVRVTVELLRHEDEKARGRGKRVSVEFLEVSLRGGKGGNLRRLVFSTNEYISFLDLAFQFTLLLPPAPPQQPTCARELYERAVLGRLQVYRELAEKAALKLEQFRRMKDSHPSFRHTYAISPDFEAQFAEREVADLSYLALKLPQERAEDNVESHFSIQKYDSAEPCLLSAGGVNAILCDHFECEPQELQAFIEAAGRLVEGNIRALFERLVQLTICLLGEDQHLITASEISRVGAIVVESERSMPSKEAGPVFSEEMVAAHQAQMAALLQTFACTTGVEQRQPFVHVSNEAQGQGRRGSMEGTLTVFIHGYKGNEYDLSKIKSHLVLLLGCSHFYSIKGLTGEKASEATIRVLGETAARELMTYLALSPSFRSINLIGFSLGGVIARAMLPWLEPHRARLNLLLTIATPHLGIREVQNCLVRVGLCYMRRVAGIESIRELNSERDASACRYLLELAAGEGLEWFRSIVLVGSFEDGYVPAYSALAQYAGEDEVTGEMARRLAKRMGRAVRVAVRLEYTETLLDVITRRRSHISFLEEDCFIKYLLVRLQHLFTHEGPE